MSFMSVYNEIKQQLLTIRRDIAVNPGTPVSDAWITPNAYILHKNRVMLEYAKTLQTLYSIELLLNNETALQEIATVEIKTVDQIRTDISTFIDKIGYNYGKIRNSAVEASTPLTLGRLDPLGSIPSITITAGQIFKTLENIQFKTLSTYTITSFDYDTEYNMYTYSVLVQAVEKGIVGNVTSGTITVMTPQISNINVVWNKENVTNGLEVESDTDYIARIRLALTGNSFGTMDGYKSLILDSFPNRVKDAITIPVGDSLMIRSNGYGGMVDVYVLCEESSISFTEYIDGYNTINPTNNKMGFYPTKQPVDTVISVDNVTSFTQMDDVGTLQNSYADKTYVMVNDSPPPTKPGDTTYTYFGIINEIQSMLNNEHYAILNNTLLVNNAVENMVLVKLATKMEINISARITILQNFDPTTVETTVKNNINTYIASLGLGESLSQSDIINVIENSEGVDTVRVPFDIFNFVTGTDAQINDLVVNKTQYIRLSSNGLSITV